MICANERPLLVKFSVAASGTHGTLYSLNPCVAFSFCLPLQLEYIWYKSMGVRVFGFTLGNFLSLSLALFFLSLSDSCLSACPDS